MQNLKTAGSNTHSNDNSAKPGRKGAVTLSIECVRKMIMRFLLEKGISKESLSLALGTKAENLDIILTRDVSKMPAGLLYNVNKHLVPLYCETLWS